MLDTISPPETVAPEHLTEEELTLWLALSSDPETSAKTADLLKRAAAAIKLHPGPTFPEGEGELERQADLLTTAMAINRGAGRKPNASRLLCLNLRALGRPWADYGDEHGIGFSVATILAKVDEIAAYGVGSDFENAAGRTFKTEAENLRGLGHWRRVCLINAWAPILAAEHARQAKQHEMITRFVFKADVI